MDVSGGLRAVRWRALGVAVGGFDNLQPYSFQFRQKLVQWLFKEGWMQAVCELCRLLGFDIAVAD